MKELEQIEIGRYRVQSHLARGGMADVYLAHDSENDQTVALKMVHESAGEYCERFQREAKAMAGLVHEHILPALDYGEYESWYFLVTPYIEYGTLNGRLAAGPLTLGEVNQILAQLAEALQFAHDQGIIHRDIKPSNILMRDGNHVYLSDFGLVKRVGQENGLTVTGYLIGTPEYMAPELAEEEATPQSDVYSLGVLLYQMLTDRVPFKANTPMGTFLRHIRENPEPPSTFNTTIPTEIEKVILRAMEKDPKRRYQSSQELYQAYQQAMRDAAIRRKSVIEQPTQIPGNRPIQVDIKVRKQTRKVRRPLLIAAFVAAILLAGVFVLVNPTFAPAGRGNSIHAADAADAKDRQTSTPAAKHVTPDPIIDSAAANRPATGTSSGDAVSPVSPANLNQSPQSSTPQQTINVVNGSNQSSGNAGGNGQGTANDSGNGNSGGGDQGVGNGGSGNGGSSGSGQSTGSSGSGSGQSTGSSGGGSGQSTGSSGGGSGQSTGSGGSGQSTGSGGSGQNTGSSGSGSGQSTGSSGGGSGQSTGSSGGGSGQSTGSSGSGSGQSTGSDGSGSGNGGGQSAGSGGEQNNGQGGGNGKGKGHDKGGGENNGNGNGKGKGGD